MFPYFGVVCPQILDIVKNVACKLSQSEDSHNMQDNNVGHQLVFEEQLQKQVEENLVGQMKVIEKHCISIGASRMHA